MNPLAVRKQLLLAESELNRAELAEDWRSLADEVRSIADQARTIRFLASATASLIANLTAFRRAKSAPANERPSWWKLLLRGAKLAGSLWPQFCPPPK